MYNMYLTTKESILSVNLSLIEQAPLSLRLDDDDDDGIR